MDAETRRLLAALPPRQAKTLLCVAATLYEEGDTFPAALLRAAAHLEAMKGVTK